MCPGSEKRFFDSSIVCVGKANSKYLEKFNNDMYIFSGGSFSILSIIEIILSVILKDCNFRVNNKHLMLYTLLNIDPYPIIGTPNIITMVTVRYA